MPLTLGDIPLPAGLLWTNEYEWHGVARAIERSVTGVPVIQATALASGRDITFAGENAWLTRAELDALSALVAATGPHLLTLHDGRSVDVQFREPPLRSVQLIDYEAPVASDQYRLTELNLITVGAMNPAPEPDPEE